MTTSNSNTQQTQASNTNTASNASNTQSGSTSPWATGQTTVNGILGSLNPLLASSGLTSPQQTAINQLTTNGQAGNPYAPAIGGVATNLLGGGGATNQAGAVNQNYQNYYNQTNPLASNTNYDPMQNPGFSGAINAINTGVTNQVNSQFAGAGRSGSPANSEALGLGLAQGEAPVIANQFNADRTAQQEAAGNLYGAGNTTANTQAGYTQQGVANSEAGIPAATAALGAQNWGPNAVIAAQNLAQSIPAQNLGLLAQIGIPIAGLGTQSSGTSNNTGNISSNSNGSGTSNTNSTPSLFSTLMNAAGLFGGGANSAATGLGQAAAGAGSGAAGLLGMIGL